MKILLPLVMLTVLITSCHHASGLPMQKAVKVSLPLPVVLDGSHQSMTIAPALEIRNISGDTLEVVHLGGAWLLNVVFDYEVVDPSGSKIPAVRTHSTMSSLVAHRGWVSLLKPGESMKWIPPDIPTYAVTKKGKYLLTVHAKFFPTEPGNGPRMIDTDRSQISATIHQFDSDPITFMVD